MLIGFKAGNFLSIDEPVDFSMAKGNAQKHKANVVSQDTVDLLKFSAIYGPNASGKSNFVRALSFSQNIIIEGGTEHFGESHSFNDVYTSYNKNNEDNKDKDTVFEYDILIDDKIYSYGFSILLNELKITREYLYDITTEETPLFTRTDEIYFNNDYFNLDDEALNRIQVYKDDLENDDNQLFLTYISNKNSKKLLKENFILTSIYDWFFDKLEIILPNETSRGFGITYHDSEYRDSLSKLLKNFDTGIEEVTLHEVGEDERLKGMPNKFERDFRQRIKKDLLDSEEKKGAVLKSHDQFYLFEKVKEEIKINTVKFKHTNQSGCDFDFDEESDGTRRLIELFDILYNKKSDKVFIIDELDRSFHALLTVNYVQKFLENDTKHQLIVTTHEDRLLDLDILRRDQIWFIEKNEENNSELYSLEEFGVRADLDINKAYLSGRFGAIPNLEHLYLNVNENR